MPRLEPLGREAWPSVTRPGTQANKLPGATSRESMVMPVISTEGSPTSSTVTPERARSDRDSSLSRRTGPSPGGGAGTRARRSGGGRVGGQGGRR